MFAERLFLLAFNTAEDKSRNDGTVYKELGKLMWISGSTVADGTLNHIFRMPLEEIWKMKEEDLNATETKCQTCV